MTNILVVDDDEQIRSLLRTAFEGKGFDVQEAGNGIEALQILEVSEPAAAIIDIVMPGMEGMETIRRIRASHPQLRIVALSGGGNMGFVDYLKYAKQLGADEAFSKPVVLKELVARVTELVNEGPASAA